MSDTTNDLSSCVTNISIGMISSYEQTGTIALSPPLTDVLKIKSFGFLKAETNTLSLECNSFPGINQFMKISLAVSGITEICES